MTSQEEPLIQGYQEHKNMIPSPRNGSSVAQQKKTIYICECGKKYMSFPALYVHGRIKHSIKLSSNSKVELWEIKQTEKFIEKTFYLSQGVQDSEIMSFERGRNERENDREQKNQKKEEGSTDQVRIQQVLKEYLQTGIEDGQSAVIFSQLIKYVKRKWGQDSQKEAVNMIPFELNEFVLDELPVHMKIPVQSLLWRKSCQCLLKFSQWLHQKHYSKFLAVQNRWNEAKIGQ